MKKILSIAASIMMVVGVMMASSTVVLAAGTTSPTSTIAASPKDLIQQSTNNVKPTGAQSDLPAVVKIIINVLLYIVGIVAVVMIVIGGFRYTSSNGSSDAIGKAKNTIMYSIIGLVVAILAYAIVNFVITETKDDGCATGQVKDPTTNLCLPMP